MWLALRQEVNCSGLLTRLSRQKPCVWTTGQEISGDPSHEKSHPRRKHPSSLRNPGKLGSLSHVFCPRRRTRIRVIAQCALDAEAKIGPVLEPERRLFR